jgi:hypothetical protein
VQEVRVVDELALLLLQPLVSLLRVGGGLRRLPRLRCLSRRLFFRGCDVDLVPRREPWVCVLVGAVVGVGLRPGLRLRLRWWRRHRAAVEAKHRVCGLQTARHFAVERERRWWWR